MKDMHRKYILIREQDPMQLIRIKKGRKFMYKVRDAFNDTEKEFTVFKNAKEHYEAMIKLHNINTAMESK